MSQFRLRETEAAAESYLPELLSRGNSYEIWSEDKYGPWIDTGVWQVLPQTHTVEYNSISLHILVPQTLCWGAKGWTSEIRRPTGSADGLLETELSAHPPWQLSIFLVVRGPNRTQYSRCITHPSHLFFILLMWSWPQWFYTLCISRQKLRGCITPRHHLDGVERNRVKWSQWMLHGT